MIRISNCGAYYSCYRSLSDIDGNGNLSLDEFCVAMHLVDMVKNGQVLPTVLPLDLVPPSYRGAVKRPIINTVTPAFSHGLPLAPGKIFTLSTLKLVYWLVTLMKKENKKKEIAQCVIEYVGILRSTRIANFALIYSNRSMYGFYFKLS